MFILTIMADGAVYRNLKLSALHNTLCEVLKDMGHDAFPTLQDLYNLSAPSASKGKRLQEWNKVFIISKHAHKRTVTYSFPDQTEVV